jgi:hypothetical protein
MTERSSPEAPRSEVIAGVIVNPRPSGKGAGRTLRAGPRAPGECGPDQVGKPLQDVDTNGAPAVGPETEATIDFRIEARGPR